jgi:hypothetical protein
MCTFAGRGNGLNLNPVESALLKSRLDQIQLLIKEEFGDSLSTADNTFIFPGAGGVDDLVLELESVTPNSKVIDWKLHRGNILTAAFDGEAVGESIAQLVGGDRTKVHYIGISVGAFCANAAATMTFQNFPSTNVRLTNFTRSILFEKPFRAKLRSRTIRKICDRGRSNPQYRRSSPNYQ